MGTTYAGRSVSKPDVTIADLTYKDAVKAGLTRSSLYIVELLEALRKGYRVPKPVKDIFFTQDQIRLYYLALTTEDQKCQLIKRLEEELTNAIADEFVSDSITAITDELAAAAKIARAVARAAAAAGWAKSISKPKWPKASQTNGANGPETMHPQPNLPP